MVSRFAKQFGSPRLDAGPGAFRVFPESEFEPFFVIISILAIST
jgi:hypothetical protein